LSYAPKQNKNEAEKKKRERERKSFQFTSGWDTKLSDLAKTADYGWLRLFSLNVYGDKLM